jgi:CDP-diacylglycerol--glycerol-3-phosphate 3-phosphatidyltransferase
MNLADKLTASRIVLAPVFFLVYFSTEVFPAFAAVRIPLLWVLFLGIEVTDMFDGMAARKEGKVTDFGKFFDPFADTFAWLTFFFCFVIGGILPPIVMLVIFYREFAILFLRNLMLRKGTTQGARKGGKIKAIFYLATGVFSLASLTAGYYQWGATLYAVCSIAAICMFIAAMVVSVISFIDYLGVYRKMKSLVE